MKKLKIRTYIIIMMLLTVIGVILPNDYRILVIGAILCVNLHATYYYDKK